MALVAFTCAISIHLNKKATNSSLLFSLNSKTINKSVALCDNIYIMFLVGWGDKNHQPLILNLIGEIIMIVNLTQHQATEAQKEAGVVESICPSVVNILLTFDSIPTKQEMKSRAGDLVLLAIDSGAKEAMIGGAPFFMSTLEKALKDAEIKPLYAFSKRESVDEPQEDGSVRKTTVFNHLGFVTA